MFAPRLVLRKARPYATSAGAGALVFYASQQDETPGQLAPILVADAIAFLGKELFGGSSSSTAQRLGFVGRVADFWGTHSGRLARKQLEQEVKTLKEEAEDYVADSKTVQRLVTIANSLDTRDHSNVEPYCDILANVDERNDDHLRMLVDATNRYKEALKARRDARSISAYEHARTEDAADYPTKIAVIDCKKIEKALAKAWNLYAYAECKAVPEGHASGLSNSLQTRIARAQLTASPAALAACKDQSWLLTKRLTSGFASLYDEVAPYVKPMVIATVTTATTIAVLTIPVDSHNNTIGMIIAEKVPEWTSLPLNSISLSSFSPRQVLSRVREIPPQIETFFRDRSGNLYHVISTPTWEEAKANMNRQQEYMKDFVNRNCSMDNVKNGTKNVVGGLIKRVRSENGWTFLRPSGSEKSMAGSDEGLSPPEINV
ncbi:unnamed protein product [Amoebophrya sp. A120]|nr:unnamed protein product [Amoebophrya sp. A120]|eukprot:GSA120T00010325001.1